MAIPKFHEMFLSVLKSLKDEKNHSTKEIAEFCAKDLRISEQDKQVRIPCGQSQFYNRVGWAQTYLKKAGLIDSFSKGEICITSEGKEVLNSGVSEIDINFLKKYKSFNNWNEHSKRKRNTLEKEDILENQSPQERIDYAFEELNSSLADDLMTEIMKIDNYEFENLVVKLLIKMGYGSQQFNENAVTKKSGDEGIDGIVSADKFGFDCIFTQAKHWKPDHVVSRPDIQAFLGALAGQGATKGLFITTSKFSKEAINFVKKQLNTKIVLVDGEMLTNLMIEYDLGVSTVKTYSVKRIDGDFFSEDV